MERGDIIRNKKPYFGEPAYRIVWTVNKQYYKYYCASSPSKHSKDWAFRNLDNKNKNEITHYAKIKITLLLRLEWFFARLINRIFPWK